MPVATKSSMKLTKKTGRFFACTDHNAIEAPAGEHGETQAVTRAPPIRSDKPAAERARDRSDACTEERPGQRYVASVEDCLQQGRKCRRVPDERTERSDVEQDMIQVSECRSDCDTGFTSALASERLFMNRNAHMRRSYRERHIEQAGHRQRHASTGGHHDWNDLLGHRYADVSARGVEPERPAFLLLRIEERDVGHRGGEVAAAESRCRRDQKKQPERNVGVDNRQANSRHGMTSSVAETIVQLRPPNTGTAKVYGSRRKAPTPLGTATSHSAWVAVRANPDAAGLPSAPAVICTTTMLHSSHTEKPMCSAKIDQIRFRLAIGLPTVSQNSGSSGRQSSIQWRPRVGGGAVRVDASTS